MQNLGTQNSMNLPGIYVDNLFISGREPDEQKALEQFTPENERNGS